MKLGKWLLCLTTPFQPFHMRARQIAELCCGFSQYSASITSATATTWKYSRQRAMQHFVFQLWRKWATVWKSLWHCNIQYTGKDAFGQFVLKGSTRYWFISDSAIIPLHKFLKHSTSSLVGLLFPSRSEDTADTYSALGSPIITSASCSSDASRDNCHGGRCRVLLINLYASFLFATRSLVSVITSPLLFSLFVKPKEKTTPCYYQDNYNPVHPLCIGYVNQESESERTKNPSDYKPISFHIITPCLKSFCMFLRIISQTGGKLCLTTRRQSERF